MPAFLWALTPNLQPNYHSYRQIGGGTKYTPSVSSLLPFIYHYTRQTPGDDSYTKQFDCTRTGFIIHHATVEVSDRRRLMSDQRSTSSHPGREREGGDRYEKRTWDQEVLGGICCRTPLDLIISMHGQEVRLSVGSGIRYERRSKNLIQIHNSWDNLVDIKKMSAGIAHCVSPFRLQQGG